MKPIHEQEWYLDAYGDVCRGKESIATHTNASPEEMRCISAAPDMARALLALGHHAENGLGAWHTEDCWENLRASCSPHCTIIRAALRKAGVISTQLPQPSSEN